jgi:hypothetical protein
MKKTIASLALFFLGLNVQCQVAKDSELFITMKKQDSIFFEKCFNQCDLEFLKKSTHADFRFYHDQGGLQDRAVFLERVKNNICSDATNKPIRKVVPESLEVFPLYSDGVLYGVIQNGVHQFYRRQKGKDDVLTSTAKFTHVYVLDNGKWLLKEVLSFDHKNP